MDFTEKKISSRSVFDGHIMHIRLDEVLTPAGTVAQREVMDHPGAVAIVALDDNNNVVLEEQYRYALEQLVTEIPAGKLDKGEDPFVAAKRELQEETGITAKTWIELGPMICSPGCSTEVIHLYIAKDLSYGETHPDADEFIRIFTLSIQEVIVQIMKGQIWDGKSIAAVLKAAAHLHISTF